MAVNKLLYVQASGPEDKLRIYTTLLLASAASAEGNHVTIYFVAKGVQFLKRSIIKEMTVEGFPPIFVAIQHASAAGVSLEACEQSCMYEGMDAHEMVDGVKIVGSTALNEKLVEADAVLSL